MQIINGIEPGKKIVKLWAYTSTHDGQGHEKRIPAKIQERNKVQCIGYHLNLINQLRENVNDGAPPSTRWFGSRKSTEEQVAKS
jgi:hypothetical protein